MWMGQWINRPSNHASLCFQKHLQKRFTFWMSHKHNCCMEGFLVPKNSADVVFIFLSRCWSETKYMRTKKSLILLSRCASRFSLRKTSHHLPQENPPPQAPTSHRNVFWPNLDQWGGTGGSVGSASSTKSNQTATTNKNKTSVGASTTQWSICFIFYFAQEWMLLHIQYEMYRVSHKKKNQFPHENDSTKQRW